MKKADLNGEISKIEIIKADEIAYLNKLRIRQLAREADIQKKKREMAHRIKRAFMNKFD